MDSEKVHFYGSRRGCKWRCVCFGGHPVWGTVKDSALGAGVGGERRVRARAGANACGFGLHPDNPEEWVLHLEHRRDVLSFRFGLEAHRWDGSVNKA